MEDSSAIRRLENGKYSVLIGRERYTLSTKLDEESFRRVVESVASLINSSSLPARVSQNEKLFLALMYTANEVDKLYKRLSKIEEKLGKL